MRVWPFSRRTANRDSSSSRSGRIGECVVMICWIWFRLSWVLSNSAISSIRRGWTPFSAPRTRPGPDPGPLRTGRGDQAS